MNNSIVKSLLSVVIVMVIAAGCKKDDKDDKQEPQQEYPTNTSTLNAIVSGDFTDTLEISSLFNVSPNHQIVSTFFQNNAEFYLGSSRSYSGGALILTIYAIIPNLNTGSYNLATFNHGVSEYFNNVIGAQNFELESGNLQITKVETNPAGSPFENFRNTSGTFDMIMKNPSGDSISITGNFKDAYTAYLQ